MSYTDVEKKRRYQREWVKARRSKWVSEHGPCVDCQIWDDLEVDHVNPSEKEFKATSLWSRKVDIREKELNKCVVRCKACHLKKTIAYSNSLYRHGTYSMWKNNRCRCKPCVMKMRAYKREYRARTGIH